jgi:ribosomal protein S18 acetylase RimI-like enzyme
MIKQIKYKFLFEKKTVYVKLEYNKERNVYELQLFDKKFNQIGEISITILKTNRWIKKRILNVDTYNKLLDLLGQQYLFIENFFIHEKYRNKHYGNMLMKILLTDIIPKQFKKYNYVILRVQPFNLLTKENIQDRINILNGFYSKFGFRKLNKLIDFPFASYMIAKTNRENDFEDPNIIVTKLRKNILERKKLLETNGKTNL